MSQTPHTPLHRWLLLAAVGLVLGATGAQAGSLDAPAAPSSTGSALYTLDDLYQRLENGTAGAKRSGGFSEPASGPSAGTMHTLDDIMNKMPAVDAAGASAADVASGKTFWGLTETGWGPQTGTATSGAAPCNCNSGTIWNAANGGTRWCDNGNGTVTDLLGATVDGKTKGRCLVWLKDAGWGGQKPWRASSGNDDAHTRAGLLKSGEAGLSDGSVEGDWRLPTLSELRALTTNPEQILRGSPGPFSGVRSDRYWSSTSVAADPSLAWTVQTNIVVAMGKSFSGDYVWPVRGGQ
ncbi:hypothetical protein CKO25_05300 [Thiocapsa imhoffii]|uniref:Lcl C-terminal domain-containing protein n=1 Tax=Thiocapsa imhoffii TaxID=382777 RepID=A0A9X1B8K9_9GAMM|nr:DUF1566 domain-containing protein [Thiocapsa imhoffii]MBK1644076.1 hypothetical protein [Thiocapsa imhoffii]